MACMRAMESEHLCALASSTHRICDVDVCRWDFSSFPCCVFHLLHAPDAEDGATELYKA